MSLETVLWIIIGAPIVIGAIAGIFSGGSATYIPVDTSHVAELQREKKLRSIVYDDKRTAILARIASDLGQRYLAPLKEADRSLLRQSVYLEHCEPNEMHLSNEEQLELLEDELPRIGRLILPELNESRPMNWKDNELESIPSEPLASELKKHGYKLDAILSLQEQAARFRQIQQEAWEYASREIGVIGAGVKGERRVDEELRMYDELFTNLSGVRFEIEGQSVETDNLILSTRGIFSIEVKNFGSSGSYSVHITKDGQWLKVLKDGHSEPMADVMSQVNRHLALKQKVINQELKQRLGDNAPSLFMKPIIVIANDNVMIHNESDMPIMRISQIYHHIMKQEETLSNDLLRLIRDIVDERRLPLKKYPVKSYAPVLEPCYDILAKRLEYAANVFYPLIREYAAQSRKEMLAKR